MKLIFLGSGSAFTMSNRQSNILLQSNNGKNLLIDCGTDVRHSLNQAGFSYNDIDAVYVSHLHADHVGGLEYLGFTTFFDPACKKPKLFVNDSLKETLWENVVSGGMGSKSGDYAKLSTYFNVMDTSKNDSFIWEGIKFKMVKTIHVNDELNFVNSFGLFFELNGKKIYLTSDSQFCPDVMKNYYNDADMIFHDCETSPFLSNVHAHYDQLVTLKNNEKSKTWLYHYQDGQLPNALNDGFKGFVEKGQIFV